ncbi:hypothetical protein [Sphingomonas oryzagri]
MRYKLIAIALLMQAGQPALAQIEKYDANSGKYVTSDPFAQSTPSAPSPYRLNPRVSRNSVPQSAQGAQQTPSTAVPGAGASASAPATSVSALSQPLVPMGGMAMYGDDAGSTDPFAKPDWWPQ